MTGRDVADDAPPGPDVGVRRRPGWRHYEALGVAPTAAAAIAAAHRARALRPRVAPAGAALGARGDPGREEGTAPAVMPGDPTAPARQTAARVLDRPPAPAPPAPRPGRGAPRRWPVLAGWALVVAAVLGGALVARGVAWHGPHGRTIAGHRTVAAVPTATPSSLAVPLVATPPPAPPPAAPAAPTMLSAPPAFPATDRIGAETPVNLRAGPGTGYPTLGALPTGTPLAATAEAATVDGVLWRRFRTADGRLGWVRDLDTVPLR